MLSLLITSIRIMPPRIFHTGDISVGQTLELATTAGHHATRVLRARIGDSVTLFNGKGGEFLARIVSAQKLVTTVTVDEFIATERESSLTIELAQALCVNEKMDLIIQKSVELGVSSLQPIITTRSIVRLSDERAKKRLEHWQRVIISACEQCGRNYVPTISPLVSLVKWIDTKTRTASDHLGFALSVTGNTSLKDLPIPRSTPHLSLVVGPEGGFTTEEAAILEQAGFLSLRLGNRILRTETAAMAAIAALQMQWGDF